MDMIEYVGEGGDGSKRGGGDDGVAPENEELADHLLSRYVMCCGVVWYGMVWCGVVWCG
jgi:hypothetical protein